MINSDAIQSLIESLQGLFPSQSPNPTKLGSDKGGKPKKNIPNSEEKKITVISIGAMPKQGMKIPRLKKEEDDDGVE